MRRNACGVFHSTATRNRATKPNCATSPVTPPPRRRSHCAMPATSSADIGEKFLAICRRRVVERYRSVRRPIDELPHELVARAATFIGSPCCDPPPLGDKIQIVDDFKRLVHVVRHDNRSDRQRVI